MIGMCLGTLAKKVPAENAGDHAEGGNVESCAGDEMAAKGKSAVESSSEEFPFSLMPEGEDAILAWLNKKNLMFVPIPAPVVAGKKNSDAYTRRMMQLSSEARVAEMWEKDLRASEANLVVDPPASVADMMAIADGYQYGFPQQRVLEMMRSEHCNHVLYQFFKAKFLKLEAKLRHREEELSAAEAEINELRGRLKEKEELGKGEEGLRSELAIVRNELEQTRRSVSSFTGLYFMGFSLLVIPSVFWCSV